MNYLVALLAIFLCRSLLPAAETATNSLAIYLVAGQAPALGFPGGTSHPQGVKLDAQPLVSDKDFASYDTNEHVFALTAEATKRLATGYPHNLPFVLVASGEPVYVGVFSDPGSGRLYSVPTLYRRFSSYVLPTNATFGILPGILPRGAKLSRGTGGNVIFADDVRNDPRVFAAVKKLGL